ncbi:hypothetical protein FHG66_10390 [Rubellimicrobium rubrum]|uniref:Asl1-like glycosyl hydrolase catalytic domain-containing protein n=1 Tax=Rubellimicrobium rubrum TaxID=2585369 RepID=A0A5C4MZC5_9RHOB|nr:glycosyl hydrolase [Rubellimicrobium rubrum]TNC49529.1 hypothetical protein FHG66_10390 [Rubellimicrobium rubrum]
MTIENPEKIGLGTWERDSQGTALNDLNKLSFGWHYTWSEWDLWTYDTAQKTSSFVAMCWDERDVTQEALARVRSTGTTTLLGFNEPDNARQADLSVKQALDLWPQLQATGLRLGSPAATMDQTLGPDSWLGQFMAGAEASGLRVDFIAVHYYSTTGDVDEFKAFLEAVHKQYGRPVWVTEWTLADWDNPGRFSATEQAEFARAGTEMMDDLTFVERHAWFSAYEGGDNWHLNSGVFNSVGELTEVGQTFLDLNTAPLSVFGTVNADSLTGSGRADVMVGLGGDDRLAGGKGYDTLKGGAGSDTLDGGADRDRLEGGLGDDLYVIGHSGDVIVELANAGTDQVKSSVGTVLAENIENLFLSGASAVSGTGNRLANQLTGNSADNILSGLLGNDRLLGADGNDTLKGGDGADRLEGGAGMDRLIGGPGTDHLYGGVGADTLDGAGGADQMWGGAGADRFVFSTGQDRICDFVNNVDEIWIDDALWGGSPRTVASILRGASLESGVVIVDFGTSVLHVAGVSNIGALADDLIIF